MKANQMTADQFNRVQRAIRTIRNRIFDMSPEKQDRAGEAIQTLKDRIYPKQAKSSDYHWMYAAE